MHLITSIIKYLTNEMEAIFLKIGLVNHINFESRNQL